MDWGVLRKDFPSLDEHVFLDTAYSCPYFRVWDEAFDSFKKTHENRRRFIEDLESFKPVFPEETDQACKSKLAKLMNAKPEEIIFLSNTTEGLNLVCNMIDWKEGDEVLINDGEFSSNIYPWRNLEKRGVIIRGLPTREGAISVEEYGRAISSHTRMIPITHVNWITGFKHDLEGLSSLAKEFGAWICVDAIQSLGATPVNAETFDFLSSGTYKWLLNPVGIAILYVKESHSHLFSPPTLGYDCMSSEDDLFGPFQFKSGPQKFQYATKNYIGLHMLNRSLDYMNAIGFENIFVRILELTRQLIQGLEDLGIRVVTPRDDASRAGIVSMDVDKPREIVHALAKRNIWVNLRGRYIRVSPNFYNNEQDIDALINALKELRSV